MDAREITRFLKQIGQIKPDHNGWPSYSIEGGWLKGISRSQEDNTIRDLIIPVNDEQAAHIRALGVRKVKPGNISSNSKLGFLTAPTELARRKGNCRMHFPISWQGKLYKDVEAAYQANKSGSHEDRERLMKGLLKARFEAYPQTHDWVLAQGGDAWLRRCSHTVNGNIHWEGQGEKSRFIRALIHAFRSLCDLEDVCPGSAQNRF